MDYNALVMTNAIKPEQEFSYNILQNDAGEMMIAIKARDGEPVKPIIVYDGKEHALLYRDPGHTIILDYIHPDARPLIAIANEIMIAEFSGENWKRDYTVPVRMVKMIPLAKENYPKKVSAPK